MQDFSREIRSFLPYSEKHDEWLELSERFYATDPTIVEQENFKKEHPAFCRGCGGSEAWSEVNPRGDEDGELPESS